MCMLCVWKPISGNVMKKKKDPISHYFEKLSQNKELVNQNNEKRSNYRVVHTEQQSIYSCFICFNVKAIFWV